MKEAEQGRREVFFADASHFVYGAFLAYLWCAVRLFVPTGSGRKRLNLLGAVGYASGKVVTEINTGAISSNEVCSLLRSIRRRCRKVVHSSMWHREAIANLSALCWAKADVPPMMKPVSMLELQ